MPRRPYISPHPYIRHNPNIQDRLTNALRFHRLSERLSREP
jgi:hypothetical protein